VGKQKAVSRNFKETSPGIKGFQEYFGPKKRGGTKKKPEIRRITKTGKLLPPFALKTSPWKTGNTLYPRLKTPGVESQPIGVFFRPLVNPRVWKALWKKGKPLGGK